MADSRLFRIAQNAAIDAQRRGSRLKRAQEPQQGMEGLRLVPAPTPEPADHLEREELRQQVLAVLRSLPEEYRVPLSLRYLAGADYETIGTQLGLTNGSLRGLLHRGLKMLRARLPEFGTDD